MRPGLMFVLLFLAACVNAADYSAATGGEPDPRVVPLANYQATLDLFAELDYTPETWTAGIREVPRIYLSEISPRWSKTTTQEIDVKLKKQLFFRAIGPLALRSNELILADRARLEELSQRPDRVSAEEQRWVEQMAEKYRFNLDDYPDDTGELLKDLLSRVDIIPPSLVLAQAAEESGWGTSRFAFTGNALFGQWTWGDNGIRPEEQRGGRGDYKIAAFDAPLQSVQAHALNLNTHHSYLQFRIKRRQARAAGRRISGNDLAGALTSYSERGTDYVKTIRSIIGYNRLDPVDDAFLGDGQAIVLTPTD